MLYTGNDVIDLSAPEAAGKHLDQKFVRRVFTAYEQQTISLATDPDRMLWMMWAAKETAYKIFSKALPQVLFSHRLFRVSPWSCRKKTLFVTHVFYRDHSVRVTVDCNPERIHAAGQWSSQPFNVFDEPSCRAVIPEGSPEDLQKYFTDEEWKSVQSRDSAWVRYLAKRHLEKELNIPFAELEIVRLSQGVKWSPPVVYRNRVQTDIDISLSHHGKWMAWAWSCPSLVSID